MNPNGKCLCQFYEWHIWAQKHKKKDTPKDRPVRIINREDLGYMKPGLIDKVNQTNFIF
jgi:hypothetical protein